MKYRRLLVASAGACQKPLSLRARFVSLPAFALLAAGAAATGAMAAAQGDLDGVKRAMSIYLEDIARAEADGFINTVECIVDEEGRGGMGVHLINMRRMQDPAVVANEPEALLYEPTKDGMRLRGVEYFVSLGAAGAPIPDNPPPVPTLFGQKFHGPMAGHSPQMPPHYDLTVWFDNPDGTFEIFNKNVNCPAE